MQVQTMHQISALVVDGDNVGLTGQRGAAVDLIALMAWLRQDRGFAADESVICSNWLSGMECSILRAIGFVGRFVEARTNCDDAVALQIEELVERKGVRNLYLAAGDGGYCRLLARLQAKYGLKVHLIARRGGCSKPLAKLCQRVTYIDGFTRRAAA